MSLLSEPQTAARSFAATPSPVLTLANQLTACRLVVAVALFALLGWERFQLWGADQMIWAMGLFIAATATDALDGYLARRCGQVTTLGRILDPFVDKIVVCGTFIFLLPIQASAANPRGGSGLTGWIVTIIVARELLVTALRSFLERQGADFSAAWSGKLKMALQCVTISWILWYLGAMDGVVAHQIWGSWMRDSLIWLTVLVTAFSGVVYLRRAVALLG